MQRLSCLLNFFSYAFLCGDMIATVKKQTIHQNLVLSPLIKHFVRESLKLKNTMIDDVCWIVHRQHEVRPFLDLMKREGAVVLSEDELHEGENREVLLQAVTKLMRFVKEKEMMRLWEIPSIVNGNELVAYGVKKGPGMKEVMDAIRDWMILHPHGTKEACIRDVLSCKK